MSYFYYELSFSSNTALIFNIYRNSHVLHGTHCNNSQRITSPKIIIVTYEPST